MSNYFGDQPPQYEPRNSSGAGIVLAVFAVLGGLALLSCGGLAIMGYALFSSIEDELNADAVVWDSAPVTSSGQRMNDFNWHYNEGDFDLAMQSVEDELAENPDSAVAHNNMGWILATCPLDEMRDGEQAVEHAKIACEATNHSNSAYLDTLAAAYAECEDFEQAVEWQQKAIDLQGVDPDDSSGFQARLELYKDKVPYRHAPYATGMYGESDIELPSLELPLESEPEIPAEAAP